jgi:hypothetical protein
VVPETYAVPREAMTRTAVATDEGGNGSMICVLCGTPLPVIPHALAGTISCGRCRKVYVVESVNPPRVSESPEG